MSTTAVVDDDQTTNPMSRTELRRYIDQRAGAWAQMCEVKEQVRANKGEWTSEHEQKWDALDAEMSRLEKIIGREERNAALDSKFAEVNERTIITDSKGPNGSRDQYREAFEKYVRYGFQGMEQAEVRMIQDTWVGQGPDGQRAQAVGTGSAGGYTAPQGFWAKVTETLKFYGGAEAGAEMLNTTDGNAIPWPTNDDTGNTGALLSENTQISEQALTFGQVQLDAWTFTSKLVLVSLQLLQDSGVDIEAFVAKKLGQRLGRAENTYFTTGTGTSQPQGYITGGTTGKTTASATAITFNEIIDLVHSVDAAYRASGNCRFKLHDLVLAYVRKIRDDSGGSGLGRPIWEPSVQIGVPNSLLGYPYDINNDMASTVATTNKTMAFGDFTSGFVVRRVSGGQLIRMGERYIDYLQIGFHGFERADSGVQDASAYKLLVQA